MQTERLESMSPRGYLRLHRQDDGDIIVHIGESDGASGWKSFSTVEFCTPFSGGGGSRRTHAALCELMAAMAADNLDRSQCGRRPPESEDAEQQAIVDWVRQMRLADAESVQNIPGRNSQPTN